MLRVRWGCSSGVITSFLGIIDSPLPQNVSTIAKHYINAAYAHRCSQNKNHACPLHYPRGVQSRTVLQQSQCHFLGQRHGLCPGNEMLDDCNISHENRSRTCIRSELAFSASMVLPPRCPELDGGATVTAPCPRLISSVARCRERSHRLLRWVTNNKVSWSLTR